MFTNRSSITEAHVILSRMSVLPFLCILALLLSITYFLVQYTCQTCIFTCLNNVILNKLERIIGQLTWHFSDTTAEHEGGFFFAGKSERKCR
jgi:hypothetical protein